MFGAIISFNSLTLTVELGVPGAAATAAPGIGMLVSLLMCWPLFNGDVLKLGKAVFKEKLKSIFSSTISKNFSSSYLLWWSEGGRDIS